MSQTILERIVGEKRRQVERQKGLRPLQQLQEECAHRSPFRSLRAALQSAGVRIVAEIKRASPSKGALQLGLDPAQLAQQYQLGGAAALSVLTEEQFFKGSAADLISARAQTTLPVLRKEFIFDPYQLVETVAMGGDAVLLIARILDNRTLQQLHDQAVELGLEVLVEVHSAEEWNRISKMGFALVGVNNRNLATFETDLSHAISLAHQIEERGALPIALSGIETAADLQRNLQSSIRRFLIGEQLVRSADPVATLRQLTALSVEVPQ